MSSLEMLFRLRSALIRVLVALVTIAGLLSGATAETRQNSTAHHSRAAFPNLDLANLLPSENDHSHGPDGGRGTEPQHSHDLSGHSHDAPNAPSSAASLLLQPEPLWHESHSALTWIAPVMRIERPPRHAALS